MFSLNIQVVLKPVCKSLSTAVLRLGLASASWIEDGLSDSLHSRSDCMAPKASFNKRIALPPGRGTLLSATQCTPWHPIACVRKPMTL